MSGSTTTQKLSDTLFQKSLQDLIKGIRGSRDSNSEYISKAIAECKTELKSIDPDLKAEAIRKLTYLQMHGYNMSWSAFGVIEVMSQPRFAHKRIGYLAANQSFNEQTELLLLTTNLFKKEFANSSYGNSYEIGCSINSLANVANKDLARDCIGDIVNLINHPRPYVRKKAVLSLYKLYVKFPAGLRLTFDKLSEKLDDPETSVVSCAVNVICELANKNPKNYLSMAPKFFKLLTTSSNNWMLIKIVKLFASLVPEEPRLARKLLDPLATIIRNTTAKSLQYECIYTITTALPHSKREDGSDYKNAPAIISLCSDYLKEFIEDSDPNLKFLGLVGLIKLMESSPRTVVAHRENILKCLNDEDVTIRSRALELLAGIVSKKSLKDLVHHLLEHVKHAEGDYRDEILAKVLYMCSKDKYALLHDFAWYTSVLLDLATTPGSKHGPIVADQLMEVALRVDYVRPYAVEAMLTLLFDNELVLGQARQSVTEVLKAAAWIVGEYSDIVSYIANDVEMEKDEEDDDESDDELEGYVIGGPSGAKMKSAWTGTELFSKVVQALLSPQTTNLPVTVQAVYIQSVMKLFARACVELESSKDISPVITCVRHHILRFLQSTSVEVQERTSTFVRLLEDFGVLPSNWNSLETDLATEEQSASQALSLEASAGEVDLMDLSARTAGQVDENSAGIAKQHADMFQAIIMEQFYPVHVKAQRRVPEPDDVDLDKVINPSALQKIMDTEIAASVGLSSVNFGVPVQIAAPDSSNPAFPQLSPMDPFTKALDQANEEGVDSTTKHEQSSEEKNSASAMHAYHMTSPAPNNNALFYLGDSNTSPAQQVAQLGDILAESFEENSSKKKKDKKKDKKKSRDERNKEKKQAMRMAASVNFRDAMPLGASESEDDEDLLGRKTKGKDKTKKSSRDKRRAQNGRDDDENADELSAIDLSAPLDAVESLPTFEHRQTPASEDLGASSTDTWRSRNGDSGFQGFQGGSFQGDHDGASFQGRPEAYTDANPEAGRSKKDKKHKKDKSQVKRAKSEGDPHGSGNHLSDILGEVSKKEKKKDKKKEDKKKKDKKDKKDKKNGLTELL